MKGKEIKSILIIQTAFIGDVILATSLIEKLAIHYPDAKLSILVRKGNESLLKGHPHIDKVLVWNKKEHKRRNLLKTISLIRQESFDLLINVQRFFSTGLLSLFSKAKYKIGFNKNPLSFCYDQKIVHEISATHETERNQALIASLTDIKALKPKLYPSSEDFSSVKTYQEKPYVCIAPTSVWFTKQLPQTQWINMIKQLPDDIAIIFLGAKNDIKQIDDIQKSINRKSKNLAGKLNLLQSAALIKGAKLNYVNDSAPMHLASAMNAATAVVFCSTVPDFGFGPLSDRSTIIEVSNTLDCRPCGLHGYKQCPKGHFNCSKVDTHLMAKLVQA